MALDKCLDVVLQILFRDIRFDETLNDVDWNHFGAVESRTLDVMCVTFFDLNRQILKSRKGGEKGGEGDK